MSPASADPRLASIAKSVRARLARTGLTPPQAKLYSQRTRVLLGQPPLRTFTKEEAVGHLDDAMLLLHAALLERRHDPAHPAWRAGAKRAAALLEWLSSLPRERDSVALLPLAAAGYLLAGYPALALGMLRGDEESTFSRLLRLFLAGDLPTMGTELPSAWARLSRPAKGEQKEVALVLEATRALGVVYAYLRWGDRQRLTRAIRKLQRVASVFAHSHDNGSLLLATTVAAAADECRRYSMWKYLARLEQNASTQGRLAYRRMGTAAFRSRRAILWPSQRVGVARLQERSSFVLCTPTGSGKTTVAELAIAQALFEEGSSAPVVLYIVPSRALANEVEGRLSATFRSLATRVVVARLYGGSDWGPTDTVLSPDAPCLLVCTFEKADALLRYLGTALTDRLRLVVLDEAHSVHFGGSSELLASGESRALRLESLVSRLQAVCANRGTRMIGLSAVTAGLEDAISSWLAGGSNEPPARSAYRSTRQLLGRLECAANGRTRIIFDLMDRRSLEFTERGTSVTLPYVPTPFPPVPSAPSQGDGPLQRLRPYLLWAALHLARRTEKRQSSVLISITSQVSTYAEAFATILEQDWADLDLPNVFEPAQLSQADRQRWEECLEIARDYFGEGTSEYRLMRRGIAVHHGKMPGPMGRAVKTLVERGIVRVVVATSTLSEGVNLPVEYVLLPELQRNAKPLSAQEFANVIGRAGRPGHGTEGQALVLTYDSHDWSARAQTRLYTELIQKLQRAGERTQAKSALAAVVVEIFDSWSRLTGSTSGQEFALWLESAVPTEMYADEQRRPAALILDTLDAQLVAILTEMESLSGEPVGPDLEESLRQVWKKTFAAVASSRADELEGWFVRRGHAVAARYSQSERRRIYRTALPPITALRVIDSLPEISAVMATGREYARQGPEQQLGFLEELASALADLPGFAPSGKAGNQKVKWRDVFRWWLLPAAATVKPSVKQVSKWHDYVSKEFAYRMLWAHGSVVGSLTSTVPETLPSGETLVAWEQTGLPWSALWFKDLITWGTVDPVASYLLTTGHALTRPRAAQLASQYYEENATVDANRLLDPRAIRAWVAQVFTADAGSRSSSRREWPARLVRASGEYCENSYRVLPHSQGAMITWFDIAGYALATSRGPLEVPLPVVAKTDFVLDVRTARVTSETQ